MPDSPSPVSSHGAVTREYNDPAPAPMSYDLNNSYTDKNIAFAESDEKIMWYSRLSLRPKIANAYVTTAITCMGGLLFGFASTNMTPFIGKPVYTEYFGAFTPIDQSGMTACMPGGALIGSIMSAFMGERIGRRGMVQFSALIFTIGSAIQTSCINRESLAFGRIIASIGVGTASSNVPMYLAEMVPAHVRGRFLSCFQLSVNLGILIMFYIGFGCHFWNSPSGFRLAWGIQMIPGAIMLLGAMFLHESPRWLASKRRWVETREVLAAIHHSDLEAPVVNEEMEVFLKDVEIKSGTFLDLFRKANRKQTFCAGFAMFTQQYCGCNSILYFSTSITSQIGYTGVMNDVMGSVDYIVLLAATIPSILFQDKWNRRHVMLFGSFALLTSLAIVAGIEGSDGRAVGPEGLNGDPSVRWTVDAKQPAKAALAFSYIYLGFFSLSWGPVAWVYVGEIFNQDVRTVGNAFASIINWLFNFTLTIYTQSAFEHITWKTYVIFAVFCFISIPVVFFFFPETRGYELEEINALFQSDVPAFKTDSMYLWYCRLRHKDPGIPDPEAEIAAEANLKESVGTVSHEEHVSGDY